MEKYEKYKDSGIPWLGMIPEHWEMRRIKYIFKELNERSIEGKETPLSLSKDDGLIPSSEKKNRTMESASYIGTKVVHPGNIVFNRFKARLFAISKYDGVVSSDYAIYQCDEKANANFFVKLFGTETYREAFNRKASGIGDGFSRLYTDDLFSMYAIFPPLSEQGKIVDFIEDKTSEIDAFVAKKEQELRLLNELKQAQIADAVTHGLNPDVKMKNSANIMFGCVPAHWEERKMKYCFTERSEKNHPDEPILCATQSKGVIPQSLYENRVVVVNKGFEGLKLVKVGDFVISLRSFEGGIEYAYYQGIISAAYTVLTPFDVSNTEYFKLLFKSHPFIQLLQTCVTGIREGQNINYKMLGRKFIPVPPADEQKAIVDFINEKCNIINSLISELEAEIAYLKEYKQRLVADAVTGQIKVF